MELLKSVAHLVKYGNPLQIFIKILRMVLPRADDIVAAKYVIVQEDVGLDISHSSLMKNVI